MATQRDFTVGATRKRLTELGYAVTSETHPDRIVTSFNHRGRRESMYAIGRHPAAIMCYPTHENGADESLDDLDKRQLVTLIVTAYLLSEPKQSKAVLEVLSKSELLTGPYYVSGFGDRCYPIQWNDANPIYDEQLQARSCFASDDRTVLLRQAIAPVYMQGRNQYGVPVVGVERETGTHIVPLDAEWKQGHILDIPRRNLPELPRANTRDLIEDIELARWGARPAAAAKDAA